MTIGEAIKLIRTNAGESQRYMADVLGIGHVHLCNVENGKAGPSLKLLAEIHKCYDFCPLALVVLSDDKLNLTRHRMLLGKDGEET